MKKWFLYAMASLLALCLCACAQPTPTPTPDQGFQFETPPLFVQDPTPTPEPTPTPLTPGTLLSGEQASALMGRTLEGYLLVSVSEDGFQKLLLTTAMGDETDMLLLSLCTYESVPPGQTPKGLFWAGKGMPGVQEVSGLGDSAFFKDNELHALSGNAYLKLIAHAENEQVPAETLAQWMMDILERLEQTR